MNYYTETIPVTLAEKLKEKGMPLGSYVWMPNGQAARKDEANLAYYDDQLTPYCNYAEVFDWLMEKGILMEQTHLFGEFCIRPIMFSADGEIMPIKHYCRDNIWHDAATKAIEKALELI